MALPHSPYAGLTSPQMSFLDDTNAALAALGIVPCTAAGTNLITLSPGTNTPTISAYANFLQFSFIASATSTGSVTLQVGSLPALPVYRADGTTQLGTGEIVTACLYNIAFNQSLNSGAGGWVVLSASPTGVVAGTYQNMTATVDAGGRIVSASTASVARSYLAGMQMSNDSLSPSRSINISAGTAADSANATSIILSNTFNKTIGGAWVAGSGNAGLGTGITLASSACYHVFSIINNSLSDAYLDTTSSAVNKPASTTAFRRIGSVLTNNASTSGQISISQFSQNGDKFLWNTTVQDINQAQLISTATLATLTVPTGVLVDAMIRAELVGTSGASQAVVFTSPFENDQGVTGAVISLFVEVQGQADAGHFNVGTNPSGQIRWRGNNNQASLNVGTYGWIDRRGRDN